jgi:S-(hydroxymethyl)glutathione dehydrogenase/alcohol dehydrogenase
MKTLSAILVETGKPLEVDEIQIPALRPGQALVKISHSGVCGSQLNEIDGKKGHDKWLPHCLGHEAIGEVIDIGSDVTRVRECDHVVLSWLRGEGIDAGGAQYQWGKKQVNAGPVTTFQEYAVVSENRMTVLRAAEIDEIQVLLGCAAPTGMGAILNVLRPRRNESILILGVGGIGLCAVVMAKELGLSPIIAADLSDQRLAHAKRFGADVLVNVSHQTIDDALNSYGIGSVDHVAEMTGQVTVMNNVMRYLRPQGGQVVVVGNAPVDEVIQIKPSDFNMGKSMLGTWGGNSKPERDFNFYADLLTKNKGIMNGLVAAKYRLSDINAALDEMRSGGVTRPIITM